MTGLPRQQGYDENRDWLRYVIEEMRAGTRKYQDFLDGNSSVKFITFNFDSVIERRLKASVATLFEEVGQDEADEVLRMIPVRHVHGTLPAIEKLKPAWIEEAANSIEVTLARISESRLEKVREIIATSKILCFLGFAYYPDNLLRLFPKLPTALNQQYAYGSAFGLLAGEQERVRTRFSSRIELGSEADECRHILRKFHVFRD